MWGLRADKRSLLIGLAVWAALILVAAWLHHAANYPAGEAYYHLDFTKKEVASFVAIIFLAPFALGAITGRWWVISVAVFGIPVWMLLTGGYCSNESCESGSAWLRDVFIDQVSVLGILGYYLFIVGIAALGILTRRGVEHLRKRRADSDTAAATA